MNDFVRKYAVIALIAVITACSVGYGVWTALSTRQAGLKEDADSLTDEDERVREGARGRLLNAGIRSINPLLRAVKLGDLKLRVAATKVLGEVGERDQERLVDANIEKVVKTLAGEIAKESPDEGFLIVSPSHELRLSVATTLGQYSSEASVELLLALLGDKAEDVRLAARNSLVSAGIRGSRVLARRLANKKLPKNPLLENAVDALVHNIAKDMLDKKEYEDVRMRSARALRDLGGSRIQQAKEMVELMLDEDAALRMRKIAAEVVPDISPERLKPLAPELKKGLKKDEDGAIPIKNGAVALGVAKTLAGIGEPEGMEYVIECLKNGDAMVRLSAAEALNELGVKAKKEIIENLDNPVAMVRGPVLRVLPEVEAREKAEQELMAGLDDSDGDVRTVAAIGLGEMKDPDAIRKLISRLDDRRSRVRHYAEWSIGNMEHASKPYLDATLDSFSVYDYEKLVSVVSDMVIQSFKQRMLVARQDAVDEAIFQELKYRRMNLPTPWAVRVTAKGQDGKDLSPVIIDVREVFVFLATLSRMTGVPEERLLLMGRDVVESLKRHRIRFAMYEQLDPSAKTGKKNVVPVQDSSLYVIAGMLGVIGDESSIDSLLNALESDDLKLLSRAAWAIGMIADRTKGAIPKQDIDIEKLLDRAENSKPGTNDPTAVKTAHMLVREKSVETLGKIGDAKTKSKLQEILVCDAQARVRTAASIAISTLDGTDRRVLFDQYNDVLKNHTDQSTRAAAVKKIGGLGSFEARDLLLKIIRKPKEYGVVLDAAEAGLKTLTGKDYSKEVTAERLEVPKEEEKTEETPQEAEEPKGAKPSGADETKPAPDKAKRRHVKPSKKPKPPKAKSEKAATPRKPSPAVAPQPPKGVPPKPQKSKTIKPSPAKTSSEKAKPPAAPNQ